MTYLEILDYIKRTALAQHNINWIVREFTDLNREDTKYSAIVIQDRDGDRTLINDQNYITYTWYLGYVDRLTGEKNTSTNNGGYHIESNVNNRDDVISTGISVLNNIVNSLNDNFFPALEASITEKFNTFYQRFTAECAGVYVVLSVRVAVSDCQDYDENIMGRLERSIIKNGTYTITPDDGLVAWNGASIAVDVHPSESLTRTFTSNSTYSISGEWKDAEITVAVSGTVKPEEVLSETIVSNGSYSYNPTPGSVFSSAVIDVSVPEKVLKSYQGSFDVSPTSSDIFLDPSDSGADGFSSVAIEMSVMTNSVVDTFMSNGNYRYEVGDSTIGDAYIDAVDITVDVHPSVSYSGVFTSNGTTAISGEWKDGSVTVDVHPSQSLTRTFTSNSTYNISGEWKDAEITVEVSEAKVEVSLVESITSNGSYSYTPDPGSVYNSIAIGVDVHPSVSYSGVFTSNGTTAISGDFSGGSVVVSVPTSQKPEQVLSETVRGNGTFNFEPSAGYVFSRAVITTDVHPSVSYSGVFTSNGTTAISGDFSGGSVVVSVPVPTMSTLSETITSNGSYTYTAPSGRAYDTVAVEVSVLPSTVTLTQSAYDDLSVKDPDTIYLIYG